MLSLIKEINDVHHCKETGHVLAIVRTGHGQLTWSVRATWFPRHQIGDTWLSVSTLLARVVQPKALLSCASIMLQATGK